MASTNSFQPWTGSRSSLFPLLLNLGWLWSVLINRMQWKRHCDFQPLRGLAASVHPLRIQLPCKEVQTKDPTEREKEEGRPSQPQMFQSLSKTPGIKMKPPCTSAHAKAPQLNASTWVTRSGPHVPGKLSYRVQPMYRIMRKNEILQFKPQFGGILLHSSR